MSKKVTIEDLARITVKGFEEIKTILEDHGEQLKDHGEKFKKIDQRFNEADERLDEIDHHLEEVDHRLEKVEFNTQVYPHDKEFVYKKFADHEIRIKNLELKKA